MYWLMPLAIDRKKDNKTDPFLTIINLVKEKNVFSQINKNCLTKLLQRLYIHE